MRINLFNAFVLVSLSSISVSTDPVNTAIENYKKVDTYQVTLKSKSSASSEIIRYYYKRPGFIRMEFIKPYNGAVLVYDPSTNKVRLRPFPFLNAFVLTLSPDNKIIRSARGHTVDASDIGALLKTARMLQDRGKTEILGNSEVDGRAAMLIDIKGDGDFTVDGIHQYHLWFDKDILLPIKAVSYDINGEAIEEVSMSDIEINVEFPDNFFTM